MEQPQFSIEALDFEQKKQEALLREAKAGRKMEEGEAQEFFDEMDSYKQSLMEAMAELRAKLSKTTKPREKSAIESKIADLESEINEFDEGAEDFKKIKQEGVEIATSKDVK